MNRLLSTTLILTLASSLAAQTDGSITPAMLDAYASQSQLTPAERAIKNGLASTALSTFATNADNKTEMNTYFSHRVPSHGITDQKSSGRCWLFTGLNVLRSEMINQHNLPAMEFSQSYLFFYDQLEKSNLFLQAIIDTRKQPLTDQTVEWLMQHPLSDGGTFTGVADLIAKYGLVPAGVMPETYATNNTAQFTQLIKRKLRENALRLREAADKGKRAADLESMKQTMLKDVYHMLVLGIGEPVKTFTWAPKDAKGLQTAEPKTYTPQSFYAEWLGEDLTSEFILLMNDPTRPYWKTYEIQYDRHTYDGHNWTYLNVPMDEIKTAAIASIKDKKMMYMSCDVRKELDSARGLLDVKNFDYSSVLGVDFGMNKKERIQTFDSGSTHAMTLMAVDLDSEGTPQKWMVENSWGATSGYQGHLIMTDEWLDEYLFRLVVNKRYVNSKIIEAAQQKPTILPCWDPMYASDN